MATIHETENDRTQDPACPDCDGHLTPRHGTYEFENGETTSTFLAVCETGCRRRFISADIDQPAPAGGPKV